MAYWWPSWWVEGEEPILNSPVSRASFGMWSLRWHGCYGERGSRHLLGPHDRDRFFFFCYPVWGLWFYNRQIANFYEHPKRTHKELGLNGTSFTPRGNGWLDDFWTIGHPVTLGAGKQVRLYQRPVQARYYSWILFPPSCSSCIPITTILTSGRKPTSRKPLSCY